MSFVKYGNDATFGLREKVKPLQMFRRSAGERNASNGHVHMGLVRRTQSMTSKHRYTITVLSQRGGQSEASRQRAGCERDVKRSLG